MGLPSPWIKHLPQDTEAKEKFEAAIRNSTTALDRLRQLITEELEAIDRSETSDKQFEDPNWPFKQAYWNGQRSKLRFLQNLLTLDPK